MSNIGDIKREKVRKEETRRVTSLLMAIL